MSDRILIGTRKGLFTVERAGGGDWRICDRDFLGDNISMLLPDARDGWLYVAINHGHFGVKIHRRIKSGENWEQCVAPSYPAMPKNYSPPPNPMGGKQPPWNLELVWCLEAGGDDEPGVIWAGTIPGGLFRSSDRGDTWSLNRPLWDEPRRHSWFGGGYDYPGIHSILVDPADSRHVVVGVSCGGVWETCDGGETWRCRATGMRAEYVPEEQQHDPDIQDPHRIVHCPADPTHLWAQHHNGVFRSTDGAATWQEIHNVPCSAFGFAVAVHPADPNTAWFVPAVKDECRIPVDGRVVVTRTRDGGKTFDVLADGLPDRDAYDLTYRHALDVDESGDRLVFGSTTGSVWVSENQGDRWTCVSNHLPPVHCTRFVH